MAEHQASPKDAQWGLWEVGKVYVIEQAQADDADHAVWIFKKF